ncbi:sensor histidine kinase [Natronincola ferrireducens]|uniref:histidine kinase n=1 Tax=Natronincola ferrireducens TaxID=393762 RepID=A0A1G8Y3X6_9FIRM|nr:MASE3 domain-containing protein [Natronincola ferrireducens]SDJ97373.1 PAS domain S-box-containing protein [Natronincola ferrireducens]
MTNSEIIIKSKLIDNSKNFYREIVMGLLLLMATIYLSLHNYILVHTVVEVFSIIVAYMLLTIAINTYQMTDNHYLLFLGVAYGFIAFFDLIHTLSFKGMGVFSKDLGDASTQLRIIARYMEGITLLVAPMFLKRKVKVKATMAFYVITSVLLLLSVLYWEVFPTCIVAGGGLTTFKIVSEYIIASMIALSAIYLTKNKSSFTEKNYRMLIGSYIASILSAIAFTHYIDVYDFANMIGHVLKGVSFYLIYKAFIETSIKEPYKKLMESEDWYRGVTQMLPTGLFIYTNYQCIFTNSAFQQMMGAKSQEDLIGKSIFDFIHPDSHLKIKNVIQVRKQQKKKEEIYEEKFIKLNGEVIDVEVRAIFLPHANREETLVIVTDVTPQKEKEKLQRHIQYKQQQLKESIEYDKLKTEFFSNLSHEMRTPLNVIFGTVQLLDLQFQAHDPSKKMQKQMKVLKQNCYRMLKLINNLLDITKIDAGYFETGFENCNIVSIIEDITDSVIPYGENKGITFLFDTDIEEKIMAVDINGIERIMLNLLSNAIKFTDAGGSVNVNIYDKTEKIVIVIKDTGSGIPPDKLPFVFDRFRQANESLKKNHQGTGIGLSLVESLVKIHDGDIRVESEVDKGTSVFIELPVTLQKNLEETTASLEDIEENLVEKINIEFSDIYTIK